MYMQQVKCNSKNLVAGLLLAGYITFHYYVQMLLEDIYS